jgi:eukaryotic-like serine/threonine-protein kinase
MPETQRLSTALADRYRIERELGQGGMATVYLAEDLRHERKVALKVLKPELAAVLGAERFVVEIKTTARLQHPHILPLFDSGTADGFLFYVMPYVEGETLRQKLDRERQLGVEEAVLLARQVADALDYAHRHGVIHRDIKPENILLHDGRPVVADFGIALAVSAAAGGRMTETGLSLGTPYYMSPEQATAEREITGRSDIYSLASVLYEMLAGQPPHMGGSAQQVIMKIIAEPAEVLTKHRKSVPEQVAEAIAKALEKLPADRFASAADFSEALVTPGSTVRRTAANSPPLPTRRDVPMSALAAAAAFLLMVMAVGAWGWLRGPEGLPNDPAALVLSLEVPRERQLLLHQTSVSTDGRLIVYAANEAGRSRLYVRHLDGSADYGVEGTEGGVAAIFSPDSKWLAFFMGSDLWRVRVEGGRAMPIGSLPSWRYEMAWLTNDTIVLSGGAAGLWAIPVFGGAATRLTTPDSAAAETHVGVIPVDGRNVLFEVGRPGRPSEVAWLGGDSRKWKLIGVEGAPMFYFDPGVLVVRRASGAWAVRIDPGTGKIRGPVKQVTVPGMFGAPDDVRHQWRGPASPLGIIGAAASPGGAQRQLVWVDREGRAQPTQVPAGPLRWIRLAPDDSRVAFGSNEEIRVFDLRTGAVTRLGSPSFASEPAWSPDGRFLAFSDGDSLAVRVHRADGSGSARILGRAPYELWPTDWSPDGTMVLAYSSGGLVPTDGLIAIDTTGRARVVVDERGMQRGGRFSPDGRWLAYASEESGRSEILVQPWPGLEGRYVVSVGGGTDPVWSRDGRELFYRQADALMAVGISATNGFSHEPPRLLFRGRFWVDPSGDQAYDVSRDGRFLMYDPGDAPVRLMLIANITGELLRALGVR